jgi:hypothetical protein
MVGHRSITGRLGGFDVRGTIPLPTAVSLPPAAAGTEANRTAHGPSSMTAGAAPGLDPSTDRVASHQQGDRLGQVLPGQLEVAQ